MDTTLVLQAPKWMLILTDTKPTYIKELKVVLDVYVRHSMMPSSKQVAAITPQWPRTHGYSLSRSLFQLVLPT
jgi:hypothetical protein